jgi:hypothetical protein
MEAAINGVCMADAHLMHTRPGAKLDPMSIVHSPPTQGWSWPIAVNRSSEGLIFGCRLVCQ